jgi:hemerythrin-like domain-containing protein
LEHPSDRLAAFGDELITVHNRLRDELARLRRGQRPDLRTHCLAFCAAVREHHTAEDNTAFALLAEQFPELRPVIQQLTEDHELVAQILRRVEQTDDPAELDGLAAILESHFVYEEKKIVAALNSLTTTTATTTKDLLGIDRS